MSAPAAARRLAESLLDHEEAIVDRWVAHVRETPRFRELPETELRATAREALRTLAQGLSSGGPAALQAMTASLARRRLERETSPADVIQQLFLGREAILDVCRERTPAEVAAMTAVLDDAFDRMISGFSSSFCQLCRDAQDERRLRIERQLEGVVERSLDAMVFFDADRTVRAWNPSAERLFGWSATDMLGVSLNRILPLGPEVRREFEGAMRTLAKEGHVRVSDTRRMRADGASVWVDVSYTTVRDRNGQPSGIWAVFRDISERKQLEEENLQAERLALIGTMSAKLAHEVRNPLNSLVLGLDLIRDNLRALESRGGEAVHETEELVTSIESEMQRIQSVVEHYLQFARLPTLSMKPFELDASLRAHLELMRAELESHRIRLVTRWGADGGELRGDEAQLWMAILNLVRNSMEAMPDGGTLTIETRATQDALECDIRDTGAGMTEEVRSRIFRPFFSTKRAGTGLGMPLAQQIVHEHGGTISCTSALGQGTCFTITIPLNGSGTLLEDRGA